MAPRARALGDGVLWSLRRMPANLARALDPRGMQWDERIEFALLLAALAFFAACELHASAQGVAGPFRAFAVVHGSTGPHAILRSTFAMFAISGTLVYMVILAESAAQVLAILAGVAAAHLVAPNALAESTAALLVQAGWAIGGREDRARARAFAVYRMILLVLPTALGPYFLDMTKADVATYDPIMLGFDNALAIRIPSLVARLTTLPGISLLVFVVYMSGVVGFAVQEALRRRAGRRGSMPSLLILGAILGWFGYRIFPVAGPPFYVQDYYQSIWPQAGAVTYALVNPDIWRNCMPSLHAAFAYILFVKGGEHPQAWLRWGFRVYCIVTLLGALTDGHHWFIDIVVAMPFAVAILAAADFDLPVGAATRSVVFAIGIALTMAWFLLFWWAPLPSPLAAWSLVLATALVSLGLYRQLRGALPWPRHP